MQRVQLTRTIKLHFDAIVALQQFTDGRFKLGTATGDQRHCGLFSRRSGCRTANHQRTRPGRLWAIGNEVLGRFKVGRISVVPHGLVQRSQIPGGQPPANDATR